MFGALARSLFGTTNERNLTRLKREVEAINNRELEVRALSDEKLQARTPWLKERLAKGETLDDILPDAFATVREAARRVLGQRHFDVQLMGGLVLHRGRIAEMKTGEGKTLVATLPSYLNALTGKGVHVVTVNDYLARRDSAWMGRVYGFLGLSTGVIVNSLSDQERRDAYACDITYGTNNEFGFDYLRDNMKFEARDLVQRPFNFAIVDEVDSILIDEARTPLIISGPAADSSDLYRAVDELMPLLEEGDYEKDEKHRTVSLTESGQEKVEQMMRDRGLLTHGGLYDIQNVALVHHTNQALRAHKSFRRDDHYIVEGGKVVIIDEFTGRKMAGRRFSDGLHQALEAKEKVQIQPENQTLATITFQNYFRLYPKLAGMTGTAMTEAAEFQEIYNLEVVEIPTNVPVARIDQDDEVYRTAREKYEAITHLIEECRARQQPVLVGTTSIEKSELLSGILKKKKIPHQVLNARYHEQEALIVAQAGRPGSVTIATNMAGRGTDIQLGGNLEMRVAAELPQGATPEQEAALREKIAAEIKAAREVVLKAGGLFVLGTERHESRRIDNQLRGRSGRQGDPGGSRFFLSLEDDLLRVFGSQRLDGMLKMLGMKEGEAIMHPVLNRALERAQRKVEQQHFEVRKNLLKYDNVMNDQRKEIYEQRREILSSDDVADLAAGMRQEVIEAMVGRAIPPNAFPEMWDVATLQGEVQRVLGIEAPVTDWAKEDGIAEEEILDRIMTAAEAHMEDKEREFGPEIMRQVERNVVLRILDDVWKNHLHTLDYLRQGINLRAFAQRDPLNEYKHEAFQAFSAMVAQMQEQVTLALAHVRLAAAQPPPLPAPPPPQALHVTRHEPAAGGFEELEPALAATGTDGPVVRRAPSALGIDPRDPSTWGRTPRNAPCPCGSGKKYKHCHGAIA